MGYSFRFSFSEKDIDFSPINNGFINYNNFLINEFFNSSDIEINIIMSKYKALYGESAYNYVMSNYFKKWRKGDRNLTNVQQERILRLMKLCLNEEAKIKLEKIKENSKFNHGIIETLNTIKRTVSSFFGSQPYLYKNYFKINSKLSSSVIFQLYSNELERTKLITINNKNVFDKIYVLSYDEIKEIEDISRYIIYTKLENQFLGIKKDIFHISQSSILKLKGSNSFKYKINDFNLEIDLNDFEFDDSIISFETIKEVKINSKYKIFAEKYIAEELANIEIKKEFNLFAGKIAQYDLLLFENNMIKLFEHKEDILSTSTFLGSGGQFIISIDKKNTLKIKERLFLNYITLLPILLIFYASYFIFINIYKYKAISFLSILLAIIGIILLNNKVEKIRTIYKDLKKYS